MLHLLASSGFSGAENVAATIARGLAERWDFLYASPAGPIESALRARGVAYRALDSFDLKRLREVIRTFRPHLIHAHDYRASLLAACVKGPVISHLHNNVPWARRLNAGTLAYLAASHRFARIVAIAPSALDEQFFAGRLWRKGVVIPNAIDAGGVQAKAAGEAPMTDLVFLGRLTEQKDPLRFIRIVAALRRSLPEVRAVMLGTGELESDCRREISSLGLTGAVTMSGFVENPFPFLRASRVCLVPSKWEGFGLVALEAMSLSLPVLVSPVGGLKEIVSDAAQGWVCTTDEEFVARCKTLLGDETLRQHMGEAAREHVERHYPVREFLRRFDSLYSGVVGPMTAPA